MSVPLVDLAPALRLLLLAAVLASGPLAWVWLRSRGGDARGRLARLTALTLFLTFDLIVFGAFTRLSDSGLGCPDWPGCYGEVSPFGAHADIKAAETVAPTGPVTFSKAWIEMIHRYLAMTVGALILTIAIFSVAQRRRLPHSLVWPLGTLVWVLIQGLFGKYTVTLKLYPAIVTLHLMGGITLAALLAVQHQRFSGTTTRVPPGVRRAAVAVLVLLALQVGLGGWVSSNYAVLACSGFPACSGEWWPAMDFQGGFTFRRELGGLLPNGQAITLAALVAIHYTHRLMALVVFVAGGWLAWRLVKLGDASARRFGQALALLLLAQLLSGLSNVVLGWPLVAALAHTAGASALVLTLTFLIARSASADTLPAVSAPTSARLPGAAA